MFGIEGSKKIFPLDEVKNDNAQNTTGDAQENKVISINEKYKNAKKSIYEFSKTLSKYEKAYEDNKESFDDLEKAMIVANNLGLDTFAIKQYIMDVVQATDSEDIIIEKIIAALPEFAPFKNCEKCNETNINSGVLYGMISVYYSFCCWYGKKNRLNTIAVDYGKSQHGNVPSTFPTIISQNIDIILKSESSFKEYLMYLSYRGKPENNSVAEQIEKLKKERPATIPSVDTNIVLQSIWQYKNGPFYKDSKTNDKTGKSSKAYTFDKFLHFKDSFLFENNIDKFLFERIYHYNIIAYIIKFCNEYYELLENIRINQINDDQKEISIEPEYKNNCKLTTFDIADAFEQITVFARLNNIYDAEKIKCNLRKECNRLALLMCNFVFVGDVIRRQVLIEAALKESVKCIGSLDENTERIDEHIKFHIVFPEALYHAFYWVFLIYSYNRNPEKVAKRKSSKTEKLENTDKFFDKPLLEIGNYINKLNIIDIDNTVKVDKANIFPQLYQYIFSSLDNDIPKRYYELGKKAHSAFKSPTKYLYTNMANIECDNILFNVPELLNIENPTMCFLHKLGVGEVKEIKTPRNFV